MDPSLLCKNRSDRRLYSPLITPCSHPHYSVRSRPKNLPRRYESKQHTPRRVETDDFFLHLRPRTHHTRRNRRFCDQSYPTRRIVSSNHHGDGISQNCVPQRRNDLIPIRTMSHRFRPFALSVVIIARKVRVVRCFCLFTINNR